MIYSCAKGGVNMERKITKSLMTWKKSPTRKPLVLFGARQVGKTYSLLAFGKENYREVVYFNFENNPLLLLIIPKSMSVPESAIFGAFFRSFVVNFEKSSI